MDTSGKPINSELVGFNSSLVNDVDLVITDASATLIGSTLNLFWTTSNLGTETAEGGSGSPLWLDTFFLSEDATYDPGDRFITSSFITEPLAGGSSYGLSRQFDFLSGTEGKYLIVVTDSLNSQAETDETNNVFAALITSDLPNADLVVSDLVVPSTALIGSEIDISWTVINQGTEIASANWNDQIYFSTDATFDSSDRLLDSESIFTQTPLEAGNSYTINRSLLLNSSDIKNAGGGYLLLVADGENFQPESDEDNNVRAVPITLTSPDVDLVISETTITPSTVELGTIDISWTVLNQGTETASANWFDYVYFSSNETYDGPFGGDFYLTGVPIDEQTPLAPGESYTINRSVSPNLGAGYLLFVTDLTNEQAETDNTNNVRAVPFPIPREPISGGTGADELIGTSGNDTIIGYQGRDTLTGEEGSDRFVYTSIIDAGDRITDFEVNVDKIVLTQVLEGLGYTGLDPIADQYIRFSSVGNNTYLKIDPDGVGTAKPRNLLLVENVAIADLNNPANFEF